MPNLTLSVKAARAIRKYTLLTCLKAFSYNLLGYGARSIYQECVSGLANTNAADAAINAGREYVVFKHGNDTLLACDAAIAAHEENLKSKALRTHELSNDQLLIELSNCSYHVIVCGEDMALNADRCKGTSDYRVALEFAKRFARVEEKSSISIHTYDEHDNFSHVNQW